MDFNPLKSVVLVLLAFALPCNGQTNPHAEVKKFKRGAGTEPTYHAFVLPLDGQKGVEIDPTGDTPSKYSTVPWIHRTPESVFKQLYLSGNTANYTSQTNPIVAFGGANGGSPLSTHRQYRFGAYAGSRSQTEPYNQPVAFVIYAYRKGDFAGTANPVSPVAFQTIQPPTEGGNATAWQDFANAGYRHTAPSFHGLTTTVEYVEGGYQQEQWGTSGKSPYILTHTATDPEYYFEIRCVGFVRLPGIGFPGDLAPMSVTSITSNTNFTYTATKLYGVDFEHQPNWRADFIAQPHFSGTPIPPSYYGKTTEELLVTSVPLAKQFPNPPGDFLATDQSPELYSHPILDRVVADSGNDPIHLINRVVNEVELSNFIGYNESGSTTEASVNLGGVRRSALGTWMEKQGSPSEQCALLVYFLRKAGVPAAYCTAAHNELKMLDLRLSQLFGMQLIGAPDFVGNPVVPHVIPTNYPWVTAYINGQWRHIFPWLKDYENIEGYNLNEMLPGGYNNGHLLAQKYLKRDATLLGAAPGADNFGEIFPLFLEQSLRANHPTVSTDSIGLKRRIRPRLYTRFEDLPQPWSVTENTGPITLRESLASTPLIFDTVSVEVWSNANPTKKIVANGLRAADLHSRLCVLRADKTGSNTHNLTFSLSALRPGIAGVGDFTGTDIRAKQSRTIALDSSDDGISVKMTLRAHRTLPAGTVIPAHADAFFGLTEGLYLEDTRPFRKGDVGVLNFNFGRVSSEMIDLGMQTVAEEQRKLGEVPGYVADNDIIQGGILNVMGLSYHREFGKFREQIEAWSKIRNISFYSQGVMRLAARRDANGNLPNSGDIDPVSPIIDVPVYRGAWAGNGTARPDLQMPEPMARWESLVLTALEGSSQESATANRYWKGAGAASTVSLLHKAQADGLGIVELNADNYVAQGAIAYAGQPLSSWLGTSTWNEVTSSLGDPAMGRFHYAFATPGPITAADGTYRGLGTFIFERKGFAAYISGNLNGGFGKPIPNGSMNSANYLNIKVSYDSKGRPVVTVTNATTPNSVAAPNSVTNKDKGTTKAQLQNGTAVVSNTQGLFFTTQSQLLGLTQTSTPAVYQAVEDKGAANKTSWLRNLANVVGDPVENISGAFLSDETDLVLPGPIPLAVRRNYSSENLADGEFGWGWSLAFKPYLVQSENGGTIYASEFDGSSIAYQQDAVNPNIWRVSLAKNPRLANVNGDYAGSTANPLTATITRTVEAGNDIYTLKAADGSARRYKVRSFPIASLGVSRTRPYLEKWSDHSGNFLNFEFGVDVTQPDYGKMRRASASWGQFMVFTFDFYGRIREVVARDNRRVVYSYDFQGDLRSVLRPDGSACGYDYLKETIVVSGQNELVSTHLIEFVRKPDGRLLKNVWNGRTVSDQWATVGNDLALIRNATFQRFITVDPVTNHANGYVLVVDAFNRTTRFDITNSQTAIITHPNTDTNVVADTEEFVYYADGDAAPGAYPRSIAAKRDRRGNWTYFKYSPAGNMTEKKLVGDVTGDGVVDTVIESTTHTALNLDDEITHPNGHREKFHYEDPQNPFFWTRHEWFVGVTKVSEDKRVFGERNGSGVFTKGLLLDDYTAFGTPDETRNSYDHSPAGFRTQTILRTGTTDPDVVFNHVPNYRGEEIERTDALGRKWKFSRDDMGRPTGEERYNEFGVLVWWKFQYYSLNGEIEWEDGERYDAEDYVWHKHDGHGRPKERVVWRSAAKTDKTGLSAPLGDGLYSTTFWQHDAFNNLVKITDPRQNVTRQAFSNVGWMTQRRFYLGSDTTGTLLATEGWTYHNGGDIATHTDVRGGVTSSLYTALGAPLQTTNPDGTVTGFRYYIDGRIARNILPNGNYEETTYDDVARSETRTLRRPAGTGIKSAVKARDRRGNCISDTDSDGFTTARTFDDLNRPKTEAGPAASANSQQQSKTWTYDAVGKTTIGTNAKSETVETEMDMNGREIQVTMKSSTSVVVNQTARQYSANHAKETITRGTGATQNVTELWRDNFNAIVIQKNGSAPAKLAVTDENGNTLGAFDENGKLIIKNFDAFNRSSAEQQPENLVQFFDRDAVGHMSERRMPGGISAISSVNSAGQEILSELRLTATPTNFINRFTMAYYPAGHAWVGLLQTITDMRGVVRTFSYDEQRRLANIAATGPLPEQNQTITYGYDNRNHITVIDTAFGNPAVGPTTRVERQFDGYSQIFDEKVFIGGTLRSRVQNIFDSAGERSQLNGGTGHGAVADFEYRADGRMTKVTNDGKVYLSGFGTDGLLYTRSNPLFSDVVVQRNNRGLIEERNVIVNGTTVLHEDPLYENHGLLDAYTFQRSDSASVTLDYQYTDRYKLRLEQFRNADGTIGTLNSEWDTGVLGQLGARTRHFVTGGYNFQATSQSVFGRTIAETWNLGPKNTSPLAGNAFGAHRVSLRLNNVSLGQASLNSTTGDWTFPSLRLEPGQHSLYAEALHPSGAFTASAASNFTVTGAVDERSYNIDWNGNIQAIYRTNGPTTTLKNDAFGRSIQTSELSATGDGVIQDNVFDGLGRRLRVKTTPVRANVPDTKAAVTIDSTYDPLVEFLEIAVSVNGKRTWKVHGPDLTGSYGGAQGIGGLLATVDETTGQTFGLITDYFGNCPGWTDGTTVTWNQCRVGAYGPLPGYYAKPLSPDVPVQEATVWRGRRVDATGFVNMGARFYDPRSGRFLSPDPAGHNGGLTLYDYANGDPVNYLDPDGRFGKRVVTGKATIDDLQTGLDIAGLVPGIGEFADLANAGIYAIRGDKTNAALSAAGAIPFAGWAATGGKFVNKVDKVVEAEKAFKKIESVSGVTTNSALAVEQYALKAAENGFYPVMTRGAKEPQSMKWLEKGDVWKFGTTKNPETRYSQSYLDNIGDYGVEYHTEFSGTLEEALTVERMKILNNGALPAGNKIVK
jgi:RHS repeat-associated protein